MKPRASLGTILWRFLMSAGCGLALGWFVFGPVVLRPGERAFHCFTIGSLTAGVITLMRGRRAGQAVGLALGFALVQLGLAEAFGWNRALAGVALSVGVLLVAWIFYEMGRHGILFGKFLVAGPLLGGVYLAIAPLAEFQSLTRALATDTLAAYLFLGIIIGDGVGLGAEIAEGIDLLRHRLCRGGSPRVEGPDLG
jgi:hypothetical protein